MPDPLDQLGSLSAGYVEQLLDEYLRDPQSVAPIWRDYFSQHSNGNGHVGVVRPSLERFSLFNPPGGVTNGRPLDVGRHQDRVSQLIRAYRVRGHLAAHLDPLGVARREIPEEMNLAYHGLTEADLDRTISTSTVGGPEEQTLRDIIERLRNTYCRYIGVQFMHIDELSVRDWLVERMERTQNRLEISREDQLRILTRLTDAVIFEEFVRKKYVGAKTFSLEGGESLIPLLDLAIEKAACQGVEEIVLGMAHRGRLNVLANIIGKSPRDVFWEFQDFVRDEDLGSGDVRYHLGFSGDWHATCGRDVHLSLCFNPSHLEYVDPVVMGRMRAKQDRAGDHQRRRGMALVIHGDAAFAGEGVVQETLNMSGLLDYTVGGTLHVIVNNQLGFTTGPNEGRSTTYATDVAKMLQVPIFHVNGEDPEAVAQVVTLALDFRERFQRDVIIDMYCYRRWGHNEGDEPSFTQPLLYKAIEHRESVRDGYLAHLLKLGGVTRAEADRIAEEQHDELQQAFDDAREPDYVPEPQSLKGIWQGYVGGDEPQQDVATGLPQAKLADLLHRLIDIPDDFHLHRTLKKLMERRERMADGEEPLDWATAEALAIASLAVEGRRVRIGGQDCQRGTFSHRHAVLHDVVDGRRYDVFRNLSEDQGPVDIVNSPLCESGALGFEYGYSLDSPEALVAWEAQFGDFANAGQVIIDQFLASAEDKWRRLSGLVLLLPHGFEGQGPEHSTARLERFLTLAGKSNMQITTPTTPAQYFHLLRRQVVRSWRKPLVVFTPKSLLRHPRAVSPLAELATGTFQHVLPDERDASAATQTSRILLCGGKVYYDLIEARQKQSRNEVAIVRIEQLYPLREQALRDALADYADGTPAIWVQEEPANMGAWAQVRRLYGAVLVDRFPLSGVTRPVSASPATGSSARHKREQQNLVERALG
jgi:2-oxoglutarate dehydrogenase E1 component